MTGFKQHGLLLLSTAAAAGLAFTAISAIGLQHEWGYGAVRDTFGQVSGNGQWLGSAVMRACYIAPLVGGLSFGYLKQHFQGGAGWRAAGALLPAAFLFCLVWGDGPTNLAEFTKTENILPVMGAFACFFASMFGGEKLFAALAQRTPRVCPILLPGLLALIPMALLNELDFMKEDGAGWILEMCVDGTITFFAAAIAASWYRSKTLGTAMTVAFLCSLPFMLSNVWNLGSEVLELALTSGSRNASAALLSASFISTWSLVWTALGGAAGFAVAKRRATN